MKIAQLIILAMFIMLIIDLSVYLLISLGVPVNEAMAFTVVESIVALMLSIFLGLS